MKEIGEFVPWLGDMAVQAITLEPDQTALESATQFFDELIQAPTAIQGLAQNAGREAAAASVEDIENLFKAEYNKLIAAGVDDKAAHLIVTGLETAFTGFALASEKRIAQEES